MVIVKRTPQAEKRVKGRTLAYSRNQKSLIILKIKYKEGGDGSGEMSRGQNPKGCLAMVRSLNSIPTARRNC